LAIPIDVKGITFYIRNLTVFVIGVYL